MGVEALVIGAVFLASAAVGYFMYSRQSASTPGQMQQANREQMQPASLDSLSITQAREGVVVPLTYGKARLSGNLLNYGNLESEPIMSNEQEGASGDEPEEPPPPPEPEPQIVGYRYFLDIWQAFCIGENDASIDEKYINDELITDFDCEQETWNNGAQDTYPDVFEEEANSLTGVAHLFLKRWFIGEGGSQAPAVPTIHLVINREPSVPLNYVVLSSGINPAAVIYDLLIRGGATVTDIDVSSFNAAASYFHGKGYGLNITFTQVMEVQDMIQQVLGYVDGILTENEEGKFMLRVFNPSESSVETLTEDDYLEFAFSRPSWDELPNDFRATYTDGEDGFVKRALATRNPALIAMTGKKRQANIDLTCFRDADTGSKRLFQIMKESTYPAAEITIRTNLKYAGLKRGDVVTISHSDYGIASSKYRVIVKDISTIEKNEIGFTLQQMIETLFDDVYETVGGSVWQRPDTTPVKAPYDDIFELPMNPFTGTAPAYLLLAARQKGFEAGFKLIVSANGTDYQNQGTYSNWAQYGTLDEAYPDTTKVIDDETGILYTPYREDPKHTTISRAELFTRNRFALIGSELIAFQTVTPEGQNSIRLTGCIRGMWGTTKATHSLGSAIWIFELGSNILKGTGLASFYAKMLPFYGTKLVDSSGVTAIQVTAQNKALQPWTPPKGWVERVYTVAKIYWHNISPDELGAGVKAPELQTDKEPPFKNSYGDFKVVKSIDQNNPLYTDVPFIEIDDINDYSADIYHRRGGILSQKLTLSVPEGEEVPGPDPLEPIGAYYFNSDLTDASEEERDGTMVGSLSYDTSGQKVGSACVYGFTPANYSKVSYDFGTPNDKAVSFWIYLNATPGNYYGIFASGPTLGQCRWAVGIHSNRKVWAYKKAYGYSTTVIPLNTWTHVIVETSYSEGKTRFYINNGSAEEISQTLEGYAAQAETYIGRAYYGSVNCKLDAMHFFDKLTDQDMRDALYNSGDGYEYEGP